MDPSPEAFRIPLPPGAGAPDSVAALARVPAQPHALVLLAHGAGADMHHAFLAGLAEALAQVGVATMRYQFPYTDAGRRRIDPQPLLLATVRAAAATAAARWPTLPRFAGGKSMGGRMTTLASASAPLPVRGLVVLGFPLHPRGQTGTTRADHLAAIRQPLLLLQGTRDELTELQALRPMVPQHARLHVVEHADHGFAVLRRSGRTAEQVQAELRDAIAAFVRDPGDGAPLV
ncbi:MAG: alpha/beta hydrolase [Nannocystaceae bacterium]|nr:alpha/beta hydrolase [Nannocystaceae bacterium]